MIVSGTLTNKMAPAIRRVWLFSSFSCGRFTTKCPNLVTSFPWVAAPTPVATTPTVTTLSEGNLRFSFLCSVDRIFPVDYYVPGCPPTADGLIYAIMQVMKKLKQQKTYSMFMAK